MSIRKQLIYLWLYTDRLLGGNVFVPLPQKAIIDGTDRDGRYEVDLKTFLVRALCLLVVAP